MAATKFMPVKKRADSAVEVPQASQPISFLATLRGLFGGKVHPRTHFERTHIDRTGWQSVTLLVGAKHVVDGRITAIQSEFPISQYGTSVVLYKPLPDDNFRAIVHHSTFKTTTKSRYPQVRT